MPHIFISYAKKDTPLLAKALIAILNAVPGISAWMDDRIEADSRWATQIQYEIDRCDYVVVLLSPDVNRVETDVQRRSFVMNEIDYALQENKPILPVMVQQTKMPVQIVGIQYIDLTRRPNDPDPIVERVCRRFNITISDPKRISGERITKSTDELDPRISLLRKITLEAIVRKKDVQATSWNFGKYESDEEIALGTSGTRGFCRYFQHGMFVWHDEGKHAQNVYTIKGAICWRFKLLGDVRWKLLGLPVSDENEAAVSPYGTTGFYSLFEHGVIVWLSNGSRHDLSFVIWGHIAKTYTALSGSKSVLGFPITDVYKTSNGERCDFEGGTIVSRNSAKSADIIYQLMRIDYVDSPFNHGWRQYSGNKDDDCLAVVLGLHTGLHKNYLVFSRPWENLAVLLQVDEAHVDLNSRYCGITVKCLYPNSWFRIYVRCATNMGDRQFLEFDTQNRSKRFTTDTEEKIDYFQIPLPTECSDGNWHSIILDLEELVQEGFTKQFQGIVDFRFRGDIGIGDIVVSDSLDALKSICIDPVVCQ